MSRLPIISMEKADHDAAPALQAVQQQLGMLPNFFAGMAHHPGTLNAFLAAQQAITEGSRLTAAQREIIALAVANANGCRYCVSGHTLSARAAGVSAEAAKQAQAGKAEKPQDQVLLDLALAVLEQRGHVTDGALNAARDAGLDDATLVEIVGLVSINSLSNWMNNMIRPAIDFPEVALV
ncbi:carboxymuconolactone decarboxylase family protein [Halomonas piscis]|uniref:carboxymuconolactone decarboxylase family protein n=1 Tax=Halomonas piscis TaxID=3031727 RepID=UPI00289892B3|nr:peroxidase-related enzyme [Halomonas piscis]